MTKKLSYTKQEDLDKPRFHVILTIVMIVMVLPLGIAWFLVRDSVEEPALPIQVTSQSKKTGKTGETVVVKPPVSVLEEVAQVVTPEPVQEVKVTQNTNEVKILTHTMRLRLASGSQETTNNSAR